MYDHFRHCRLLWPSFEIQIPILGADDQISFCGAKEVDSSWTARVSGKATSIDGASVDQHEFAVFLADIFEQVRVHTVKQKIEISVSVPVDRVQLHATASTGPTPVQTKGVAFDVHENPLAWQQLKLVSFQRAIDLRS